MSLLDEITERLSGLSVKDRQAVISEAQRATKHMVWTPNPGPQTEAFFSEADELFYGGSAGGGKTDLLIGLSNTEHTNTLLLRRISKDTQSLVERMEEIVGDRDGYNGQYHKWKRPEGRVIDFGGCEYETDKQRYKGNPHDLIGFDEITDFTESQYRFIIGWNRSTDAGQRCRVVATGNPPTTPEGLWVLRYWGAWLDQSHPNPAKPGEIRFFTTINGEDTEVEGRGPHKIDGREVFARSRTFIPASLSDNPDLARTNYASVLDAMPEEIRAAYRDGNFTAGLRDHEWQVIPTEWVMLAQQRWAPESFKGEAMTAMGVDVAQGGQDQTVLAPRYGGWYAPLVVRKGTETRDGNAVAGLVVQHRRNACQVVVDCGGGWGGDTMGRLKDNGIVATAYIGAGASNARTRDGKLKFKNKRAETVWKFREALDPDQEGGSIIQLPDDPELRADLASFRFKLSGGEIQIEEKIEIKKRIGRSPDRGDAVIIALSEGERALLKELRRGNGRQATANIGYGNIKRKYR